MFLDEWNVLATIKLTVTPILKFKLFGKHYSVTFVDLVAEKLNTYMSVGGEFKVGTFFLIYRIKTKAL